MRKMETNNLIFEDYTNAPYFDKLFYYVDEQEPDILNVFKMSELPSKWKVEIIPFEEFKRIMDEEYHGYEDYMAGHADGTNRIIRVLNVEDQIKFTKHKEATIESLQKQLVHEFVHACYDEVVGSKNIIQWFSEGLATYLSHQDREFKDISDTDFNLLLNNFNATHGKGYTPAYLMERYIFENYSEDEIYKLISEPSYLAQKTSSIINESVEWIKEQIGIRTKK